MQQPAAPLMLLPLDVADSNTTSTPAAVTTPCGCNPKARCPSPSPALSGECQLRYWAATDRLIAWGCPVGGVGQCAGQARWDDHPHKLIVTWLAESW